MINALQKQNGNRIAQGSLDDVARRSQTSVAECFIDIDALILVDVSGSMMAHDANEGKSRYEAACDELARLQRDLPGKVAVVAFSDHAELCPSGFPRFIGHTTAMNRALEFIKAADGCGIRLFLISDGEPDDPTDTLRIARTFESKIDCIFIGREGDPGAEFLRQLAAATGGVSTTTKTTEMNRLGATVRLMLKA